MLISVSLIMGASPPHIASTQESAAADAFFSIPQLLEKPPSMAADTPFPPQSQAYREHPRRVAAKELADKSIFLKRAANDTSGFTGKFEDPEFPPMDDSLIPPWSTADLQTQSCWACVTWQRLSVLYPRRTSLLRSVHPSDMQQGALRDSYFLSALSALAERPQRIQSVFLTKAVPLNCRYEIALFTLGQWSKYVIDDYVPVELTDSDEESTYKLAFSGPRESSDIVELWVVLLEKAWAKMHHSYYEVQTGCSRETLTDLTGAPCQSISTTDSLLWEKLAQASQSGFIITAETAPGTSQSETGLLPSHAYTVLAVKAVPSTSQTESKIVQLRSPWGLFEWKGDWGGGSPKWTAQAKHITGFQQEQGVFWVGVEELRRCFQLVTVCCVNDEFWSESLAMEARTGEQFQVVEVAVPEKTVLYFMVCQVDERCFGGLEGGYQYSPVRLVLSQLSSCRRLCYLAGKACLHSRDSWLRADLVPGTYLVYVEVGWRQDFTHMFGVCAYTERKVTLRDVTNEHQDYLQECFGEAFVRTSKPHQEFAGENFRYSSVRAAGVAADGELREGVYVDAFTNLSHTIVSLQVQHTPWVNTRLLPPYDACVHGRLQLDLMPRETKIVLKKHDDLLAPNEFTVRMKVCAQRSSGLRCAL